MATTQPQDPKPHAPNAPRFDPLEAAQKMRAAGLGQEPSEAVAGSIRDAVTGLATKEDVEQAVAHASEMLEAKIDAKIDTVNETLRTELTAIKISIEQMKDAINRDVRNYVFQLLGFTVLVISATAGAAWILFGGQ